MYMRFAHAGCLLAALSSAAAFAQQSSSVTLYGRVNTTVESQKSGGDRVSALQNNASRWGILGKEDLGAGMKAFFKLESGFDSSTGTTVGGFNRDAYVGLEGGFGRVRLGYITNIVYLAGADYVSLHNHDTGTSADALFAFNVSFGSRPNTVTYSTPEYKGLRAEVSYSFKEDRPSNAANAVVEYKIGDLALGAGFSHSGDNKLGLVRALYSAGPFTFGGYFERDSFNGAMRNNVRLAGMYALGASEFHLNVGHAGNRGGITGTSATQATLANNYNLSRRTKLYAFYTRLSNQKAADYAAFSSVQPGQSQSSIALGIRHNF